MEIATYVLINLNDAACSRAFVLLVTQTHSQAWINTRTKNFKLKINLSIAGHLSECQMDWTRTATSDYFNNGIISQLSFELIVLFFLSKLLYFIIHSIIFGVVGCWSGKTSNLKTLTRAFRMCNGHFRLFSDKTICQIIKKITYY